MTRYGFLTAVLAIATLMFASASVVFLILLFSTEQLAASNRVPLLAAATVFPILTIILGILMVVAWRSGLSEGAPDE